MYVPFFIMACIPYILVNRSKSKHYLARQESSIDLYNLRRNWNSCNQMIKITHSFLQCLCIYLRVLAGNFEERVVVFIDLHLLLELTIPEGKQAKSTSKIIICNLHDCFDWLSKKQKSTHLKYVRRLVKPLNNGERTSSM